MDNFLVPMYLGKSVVSSGKNKVDQECYFFLASKNGVGRYLKYANYPFWAAASNLPDFLVLGEAPENVVNEVKAFIDGKLKFEVIPKTRGRSEKVLRTEVSDNQENGVKDVVPTQGKPRQTFGANSDAAGDPTKQNYPTLQQKTTSDIDSKRHCISSPPKGSGDHDEESRRNIRATGSADRSSEVRRLSGGGHGLGLPGQHATGELQCSTDAKPRTRQQSVGGILGNGRDDSGTVPGLAPSMPPLNGSIDGHGVSGLKPKRVRRTKEELASGRSLEDIRASREG